MSKAVPATIVVTVSTRWEVQNVGEVTVQLVFFGATVQSRSHGVSGHVVAFFVVQVARQRSLLWNTT